MYPNVKEALLTPSSAVYSCTVYFQQ